MADFPRWYRALTEEQKEAIIKSMISELKKLGKIGIESGTPYWVETGEVLAPDQPKRSTAPKEQKQPSTPPPEQKPEPPKPLHQGELFGQPAKPVQQQNRASGPTYAEQKNRLE